MSTSPHASTFCPTLPNHFILHAKSLARLALGGRPLAVVPSRGSASAPQPLLHLTLDFSTEFYT